MNEYALYDRTELDLSPFEQTLYDEIEADEPWALVERFSELERVSGTDDEVRAAEYITGRLDALEVPYDRYDPELYISQPHDAELSIRSPVEHTFESTKTVAFSNDEIVSGEVIFPDPETDDDLAGAFDVGLTIDGLDRDVEGKVVVVESILPIGAISDLAEAGAAAFVGIHPHSDEPHEGITSPVWGGIPNPREGKSIPDIVVANVSRSEGDELLSQIERHDTVTVEVSADVTTDWMECPLILSRIPGEADPDTDEFVLLHGHYDSWYEGVTDNATGDAGLLESARVFNEHRDELTRDLWVAWWPGHSTGRYGGSTWFTDEFAIRLHEHCVAHVNMDSPGVKDATEFVDRSKWMPEADGLARSAIADTAGKETEQHRPTRAGDYSFNNMGIPGISIQSSIPESIRDERGYHPVGGSGGNSEAWHLSTDTIEKADPDVLVRDVRVFATTIARLTTGDVLPLDHRYTLQRHQEIVDEYADAVGDDFDLGPVQAEINALNDEVNAFYNAVDAGDVPAEAANETIVELSRRLTRLNFVSKGPFEQDPAVYRPPYTVLAAVTDLTSLTSDEYRFRKVHLKRARNYVVSQIRAVREALSVGSSAAGD
jgi:hypothetical protein